MNIYFQIGGMTIVSYLLYLYLSHKRLGLHEERNFFMIMVFTLVNLSLDALSVVAIRFRAALPDILVKISCKSYIITMIWLGMAYLLYAMRDLTTDRKRYIRTTAALSILSAAVSFVTAALPIEIHDDGSSVYTAGPAVLTVYAMTLTYIISTMCAAFRIRRHRNSRRGQAVLATTLMWVVAAIIQFLNNKLLVVGFACALGVMILYIVMDNPDSHLERQLGCFNTYALNQYLIMRMGRGTPFHVLDLSVRNVRALEDRGFNVQKGTRDIVRELDADKELFIFEGFSYGLVLVSMNNESIETACDKLMKLLYEDEELSRNVLMLHVKDAQQFETPDKLLRFLTYTRSENKDALSSVIYTSESMVESYRDKQSVEHEIEQALREDRVEVFMQPIHGQLDKGFVCAEALVRIRTKDGGLVSPGRFIPVAEETGQIKALGERVLEKTCEFLRDSDALSLGLQYVDVNLSAIQCGDSTMAERLSRIVEKYGIETGRIVFEITETAVSMVKETLLENMNMMASRGYRFALDDFGKGESNLVYLVEMPAAVIKLDIDMIKAYFKSEKARVVVNSVVTMAHELGFTIVVEGIETLDEAEAMNKLGVDFIQGYLYSKPLPMEDFVEYLRRTRQTVAPAESAEHTAEAHTDIKLYDEKLAGKRILLVEDNMINSEIAQDILEEIGMKVDTAGDGMQAVNMVKGCEGGYDLIFMDVRMPVMDGYEATRRIRSLPDERAASVPIIALTACAYDEDRERALSCGMTDHLAKPAEPEKMLELIRRLLLSANEQSRS